MYDISEKIIQYLKKYKNKGVIVPTSVKEKVKEETATATNSERETFKSDLIGLNDRLKGKDKKVVLDEIEYTPLTKEEIETKAKAGVDEKYAIKKDALDKDYQKSVDDANLKSETLKLDSDEKKSKINSAYLELEESLSDNALKRGIARSSIVAEQLKNLGVEKIRDLLNVDDTLAKDLKDVSIKLDNLKSDYTSAVKNLDFDKAVEISDKIDEITKEQDEKIDAVIKYNNSIRLKQAEIDNSVNKPTEVEANRISGEMIKKAVDYYGKLPREDRLEAFDNDEEIIKLLGDNAGIVRNYIIAMP